MKCPKCKEDTVYEWKYQDGELRGVRCDECMTKWASEEFSSWLSRTLLEYTGELLEHVDFPEDAEEALETPTIRKYDL